jgi:hypothetical protein
VNVKEIFAEIDATIDHWYDSKRPGYGPISDGVPEAIGDAGESERLMPPPPKASRILPEYEHTVPMRKVRR